MPFAHFIPAKRTGPEMLDLPPGAYAPEELEGSLADIRTVNRYLGDSRALVKHLSAKVAGLQAFTALDVATGSADLPVAIAEWAQRAGVDALLTGVDINERTVSLARQRTVRYPQIRLQVADGLRLPFPDRSFDFALCSKALHHFTEPDAVALIKEMLRVARRGFLIIDLRRSWIAFGLIYLLTRLFTRNRLTRYDGPLSVLRSFTPDELAELALRAGASGFTVSREPFWLLALSGEIP